MSPGLFSWRHELGPLALGLAFTLIIFAPLAFGQAVVMGDVAAFTLPQLEQISEVWRRGDLPGWNPNLGLGQPLIGDSSLPLFYPFNALHWAFAPLTVFGLFIIIHAFAAYAGFYRWLRAHRMAPAAAVLGALVFAFGGASLSLLTVPMYFWGSAWLPWLAWRFEKIFVDEVIIADPEDSAPSTIADAPAPFRPRSLAIAAFFLALIALSSAVELCAPALLIAMLGARARKAPLRPLLLGGLAVGALGAALCGLVLAPFLALLPATARADGLVLEEAGRWSLAPLELLGLAVPRAFEDGAYPQAWVACYSQRTWYASLYVGLIPLALAVDGARAAWSDRRGRFGLALVLVFLPLAFGAFWPFYDAVRGWFPPFRFTRYPAKLLVPALVGLAYLAALGHERWARPPRRAGGGSALWLALIAALMLGAALVGLGLAGLPGPRLADGLQLLAAGGLALPFALKKPRRAWLRWSLTLLVVLDLGLAARGLIAFAPRELWTGAPGLYDTLRRPAGDGTPIRWGRWSSLDRGVVSPPGLELGPQAAANFTLRETARPNANMSHGIRVVEAFSALEPRRSARFDARARQRTDELRAQLLRGARGLIHEAAEEKLLGPYLVGPRLSLGPWRASRLRDGPPWAALLGRADTAPDFEAALDKVFEPGFDPRVRAIIEGPPSLALSEESGGAVRLTGLATDRIDLEVDCPGPALLVIREAFHPGWRAEDNGAAAPILAVDGLFRGLRLAPGRHVIRLAYAPPGWTAGLVISGLAALALLLCALWPRRPRAR